MKRRFAQVSTLLIAAVLVLSVWYARRDHLAVFDRRAGELAVADTLGLESSPELEGQRIIELILGNTGTLLFRARVCVPDVEVARPLPAILILGGLGTGRDAASLVPAGPPAVRMSVDYPYSGPDSYSFKEFLRACPQLRERLFDAAAASLLAVDYLADHPAVDPDSLFVVGCSFGAFFAPIAAAGRESVDALAVIQGGGDLRPLIEANLCRGGVDAFGGSLSALGAAVLHPFEPTRWIGRVSPRRVLFVNSPGDERIPAECMSALHAAAAEPKQVIWIDAPHIDPGDGELIRRFTRVVEEALFRAD